MIDATFQEHKNSIDNLVNDLQTKPTKSSAARIAENKNHTVILTGSTGALGLYLLQVLSNSPSVSHVYCLDRALDSSSTRSQRNRIRRTTSDYPSNRVTFLAADMSRQNFGLERKTYEALSFGPQLFGIIRLADFSLSQQLTFQLSSLSPPYAPSLATTAVALRSARRSSQTTKAHHPWDTEKVSISRSSFSTMPPRDSPSMLASRGSGKSQGQ